MSLLSNLWICLIVPFKDRIIDGVIYVGHQVEKMIEIMVPIVDFVLLVGLVLGRAHIAHVSIANFW